MTPLKTNPAYAHLAYRKAITKSLAIHLHRTFLGDELGEPQGVIISEDVFSVDQQVPVEEVQRFIEELNDNVAKLDVELSKFSLTRDISNGQPSRETETGLANTQGGQRHHKRRRHSGSHS